MVYIVFYASMEIQFNTLRELMTYISHLPVNAEITINVKEKRS
jgi:hypothetical protein